MMVIYIEEVIGLMQILNVNITNIDNILNKMYQITTVKINKILIQFIIFNIIQQQILSNETG